MSHVPGGGYGSRNVVHSKGYKTEPVTKAARPREVSHIGQALAYEPDPLFEGKGYEPPPPRPQAAGPGGGRDVMRSGSQGTHGPVGQGEPDRAPDVAATRRGKDILSCYGPESD